MLLVGGYSDIYSHHIDILVRIYLQQQSDSDSVVSVHNKISLKKGNLIFLRVRG